MTVKKLFIKGSQWIMNFKDEVKDECGEDLWGATDYDTNVIEIRKTLEPKELTSTIIHEFFHAVIHECHIHLSVDMEETIVDALSSELVSKFKISLK